MFKENVLVLSLFDLQKYAQVFLFAVDTQDVEWQLTAEC